jgi:HEAT repeat protein
MQLSARRIAPLLLLAACTTVTPPPPAPHPTAAPPAAPEPYGLTVAEEARVLEMEDKRAFDPQFAAEWIHHPNPLHRRCMALALGRVGPHVMAGATRAGAAELATLISDPDASVRVAAAFALGQIADPSSADALVQFAGDADGDVAAEGVEALSKLKVPLSRYAPFTAAGVREGVRARAVRFLFRFRSDDASALAAEALDSPAHAHASICWPPTRTRSPAPTPLARWDASPRPIRSP